VQLPNPEGELRIGMYGRAASVLEVHPGAPVGAGLGGDRQRAGPLTASSSRGAVARRRVLQTGVDGGDWLEVLEGVSVGEEIVTAGHDALGDGTPVRTPGGQDGRPPPKPGAPPAAAAASSKP
jgi:membrane fusion protein (multidrug efflux system)